jgi:hypothetical protein
MARRQPYSHVSQEIPTGALLGDSRDAATETDDGGLQINLTDDDFSGGSPPPGGPQAEPQIQVRESARQDEPRSADDEAYTRLKAQLDRAERERSEYQNQLKEAQEQRSAYEGDLRQERERREQVQRDHLVAQELAIENAMRVAEREISAAESGIQISLENADYAAAAKYQRALAQADNDLGRLREGKMAIEAEKSHGPSREARTEPQQQRRDGGAAPAREPQTEHDRIEAYITQTAHPPRVQEYMRQHYDDLFANSGARLNKLTAAHFEAKSQGMPEFGDEYFRFVDRHMGYDTSGESPSRTTQRDPAPARTQRTPIPPAAPVSRGAGTNQTTGTSITLTPAQVQFCKESGIDPKAYARQMLVINKGAADPTYTGPRWTKDMGA